MLSAFSGTDKGLFSMKANLLVNRLSMLPENQLTGHFNVARPQYPRPKTSQVDGVKRAGAFTKVSGVVAINS